MNNVCPYYLHSGQTPPTTLPLVLHSLRTQRPMASDFHYCSKSVYMSTLSTKFAKWWLENQINCPSCFSLTMLGFQISVHLTMQSSQEKSVLLATLKILLAAMTWMTFKTSSRVKEASHCRTHKARLHLYNRSRIGKSIETKKKKISGC